MKIRYGKKEEEEAVEKQPEASSIEKKIKDKQKELDSLKERIEIKEREIATLQEIGDSAMYVMDILDMLNEFKKKDYNSIDKLLEDMEMEILNLVEKQK